MFGSAFYLLAEYLSPFRDAEIGPSQKGSAAEAAVGTEGVAMPSCMRSMQGQINRQLQVSHNLHCSSAVWVTKNGREKWDQPVRANMV